MWLFWCGQPSGTVVCGLTARRSRVWSSGWLAQWQKMDCHVDAALYVQSNIFLHGLKFYPALTYLKHSDLCVSEPENKNNLPLHCRPEAVAHTNQ